MDNREVTVGNWLVVYILMCIPLVNFIMLLVWAFGSGAPASQSNWAKATLIWMVIFTVLWFVLIAGMVASLA
tara:strand:+ start:199 stop:414 length:216 start_codon:yes stop_codon:yes gene_type:complete